LAVYPRLATLGVVPLGVSAHNTEPEMHPHRPAEAARVLDVVDRWQDRFLRVLGRRLVHASDEYYLLAGRPFPGTATYEGFVQHENGIGMARAFVDGTQRAIEGSMEATATSILVRSGFFASVDGARAT